jgi:hypothetical protein
MNKIHDAAEIRNVHNSAIPIGHCQDGEYLVPEVCVSSTMRCNLACKLCTVKPFMYLAPEHPSLDELKQWFDSYFGIADFTLKLTLSGGEPLLREDLPDLVEYILKYKSQFGRMRINTNGTIIPSDRLIKALATYREGDCMQAEVLIDNYPSSEQAESAAKKLAVHSIPYILRDYRTAGDYWFNGWVDYGDFKEKKEKDSDCGHYSVYLRRGRLYVCDKQLPYSDWGGLKDNDAGGEYVDLLDGRAPVEEKREKLKRLFEQNELESCRFCAGRSAKSKRYPPAVQLSPEELRAIRRNNASFG